MRVLITRAEPAASRTAALIEKSGHEAVKLPLFEVQDTNIEIPKGNFSGYIFTSGNAISILEKRGWKPENPDAPVFCVGEKTAQSAKKLGFSKISYAQGGASKLMPQIIETNLVSPKNILYFTTPDRSFDVSGYLADYEIDVKNLDIYQALEVEGLGNNLDRIFTKSSPEFILCYSKRSGDVLARMLKAQNLENKLSNSHLITISDQAIGELETFFWNETSVPPVANEQAMLHILNSKAV